MAKNSTTSTSSKQKDLTLKTRLDHTIRPQDDFFEHVNGKWLRANPIPNDERKWGTFYKLNADSIKAMRDIYEDLQAKKRLPQGSVEQQVRDLYYTGINFSNFESQHLELLNSYMAEIDASRTPKDVSAIIGRLHAIGCSGPWRLILDADDKNSLVHILRFAQGGLSLPDRDYYLKDDPKMRKVRRAYKTHLKRVYEHLPALAPSAQTFSQAIFNFERKLAETSRTSIELRDIEKSYNKTAFAKLQADYPNIDWPAYANASDWEPDDKISIDQPEFFAFINRQLTEMPIDQWKMYLKWRLVLPYYARISERFAALKFEFFGKTLGGLKELPPTWKRTSMAIDDAIGEGAGKLYAKKHFSQSSKEKVLKLVEDLRKAYATRIEKLEWMSPGAKKEALKKLAGFKVLIGYPEKWRDFSTMSIGRESYLKNIIEAERFNNKYYLDLLHKPVSRDEWHMYPQTVNAYHDFNRRAVCFPAAILQSPFFDPSAPDAANYGAIGSIIGHELTHGFDDQGCQFDSEGNIRDWQTGEDHKAFKKRSQIIINQANDFEVLPGLKMQGELVIGEAIADLGGLEIAYDAYLRSRSGKVTQEDVETFFTNFAAGECGSAREETSRMLVLTDPHPANKFRVNGVLPHVDGFYRAYKVQQGDKLYRKPKDRAKIW